MTDSCDDEPADGFAPPRPTPANPLAQARAESRAYRKRLLRLERALRPFAAFYEEMRELVSCPDDEDIHDYGEGVILPTFGNCREAHEVLLDSPPELGGES